MDKWLRSHLPMQGTLHWQFNCWSGKIRHGATGPRALHLEKLLLITTRERPSGNEDPAWPMSKQYQFFKTHVNMFYNLK